MLTPWDNAPWDLLLRLANPFPCSAHSKHARVPGCGIVGAFHQSVHSSPGSRCFCICILVSVHSFTALVGFWDSGAKSYSPRQLEILTLLVQLDDLAIKPKMYFQFDFNWTLKLWNYSPRRIRPRGDYRPLCDGRGSKGQWKEAGACPNCTREIPCNSNADFMSQVITDIFFCHRVNY